MPVFVAAVKLKRKRRCSTNAPGGELPSSTLVLRAGAGEDPAITEDEDYCTKRNLRKYFKDFESEAERKILKKTRSSTRRATMSNRQQGCFEEEGRYSPVGMEEERSSSMSGENTSIIPNGIEKSFKARRSFSKFIILCRVRNTPLWQLYL